MFGRVVVAFGLMIGFYVLAIAIAAGLLWLAVQQGSERRVNGRAIALCLATAGLILWSIVPRRDRFVPPGPRLDRDREPRLFELLDGVARDCGQPPPNEVYLFNDVNAWVAHYGGFAGFGGRRVMGLGLPLFALFTRNELRAVLGHEFGHFHHGDVLLGGYVWQTRAALQRTVEKLRSKRNVVQWPFRLYAWLYERATRAVSRQQELAADALAARIAGVAAHRSVLEKLRAFAPEHDGFWENDVAPALSTGHAPPLNDGFALYVANPIVRERAAARLAQAREIDTTLPNDSHPSLRRRLAALADLEDLGVHANGAAMARDLLEHEPELERSLIDRVIPAFLRERLQPVAWSDIEERSILPRLRRTLEGEEAARLAATELVGMTLRDVPRRVAEVDADFDRAKDDGGRDAALARFERLRVAALFAYLRSGFRLRSPPGDPFLVVRGDVRRDPFGDAHALLAGTMPAATWISRCEEDGVADAPLLAPA
jgi:Zn-dependent protease with chaperone function